ncbi:hypothetical protein SAMN05421773_10484 [Streptomyces aidingensis]|uniref:Uncharacterized protein n=1 Tax=Streptomyces aidingensis TaxID=910347 RepID=A0A1I1K495_9ACTN|nr:hypothetical protein SAMN05421773_10484 [Streptomyces aidingensis]
MEEHTVRLAQQPEADELLARSPLAALVGMLLDQQIPMEWAFPNARNLCINSTGRLRG